MRRILSVIFAALIALPVSAHASAPKPARFFVGAAVADISPPDGVDVYSGGFGASPPLYNTNETEPNNTLNARAIYIGNGAHAVALVVVDSQGLFAALQEEDHGTSGLGTVGMRIDAARGVTTGPAMSANDIIIQGSHSHSAPTSMGIWGPVRDAYLVHVHDRVVDAITRAARAARPAYLQWASIDAPYLDNVNTNQTDSYEGWAQDGQVSVLRAVRPRDGATIVTFANVPAHPDIVNGSGSKILTADYFGAARYLLEQQLGGIGIVGGATLGREESPIQVGGIDQMRHYGRTVAELLTRALAQNAHWMTSPVVASRETFMYVPATNPLLAAFNYTWTAPQPVVEAESNVIYPINRSISPPYATGAVIGTPVTALRVGSIAYVSLNGEAFPEVRHGIAGAVHDADMIVGLSLGQDQLGYYEPAFAWAFANGVTPYGSDHLEYNVSPILGDEIIKTQVANLGSLGFTVDAVPLPRPENNDYAQMLHPGVQMLASPARVDVRSGSTADVELEGLCGNAALFDSLGLAPALPNPIHFDFGDGSAGDVACHGSRTGWFTHTYQPGTYDVKLSLTDASGDTSTWPPAAHPEWTRIVVYPQLKAGIDSTTNGTVTRYRASSLGGTGTILSYRWRFSDGAVAFGPTVDHVWRIGESRTTTLIVTDGSGTTASLAIAQEPVTGE